MGRTLRRFVAGLLVSALVPPAAGAAEDPPAPPAPPGAAAPERTLRLTLPEAVALALRNNLDLQAATFGPAIAGTAVDEAAALYEPLFTARVSGGETKIPVSSQLQGSTIQFTEDNFGGAVGVQRLLPTGGRVSLSATSDRTLSNSTFQFINPRYESRVGVSLVQPILRAAGREYTESGLRFARDSADLADYELRNRTERLVRDVETAYWELVQARGSAEVQRKSLEVASELQRIMEARLDAGAGTRVDVSQAEAGYWARKVDLIRAEKEMESAEETLLGLLLSREPGPTGRERVRVLPADDPASGLPPLPDEPSDAAVERALLDRSDLSALRTQVDQAEISLRRAESDAQVRLDLSASTSYAGLDGNHGQAWSESVASREHANWSVGLFLEIPLGNRAARARLERAALARAQSEARLRAFQSNVVVRVRNTRRDVESARQQIEAARKATEAAERQLEAEQERLKAEKSTPFEVLRLEEDLTQARLEELRALVEYRTALARYDFELGRILETRGLAPPAGGDR